MGSFVECKRGMHPGLPAWVAQKAAQGRRRARAGHELGGYGGGWRSYGKAPPPTTSLLITLACLLGSLALGRGALPAFRVQEVSYDRCDRPGGLYPFAA